MYVKKFLMSVGTFSTVALPVASVVSCGEEETKDTSGSDQSSGTEQITTAEVDDSVVKLSIDLTEINTPKELIDEILEASNMQYSENFLKISLPDDSDNPSKLADDSRLALIDYYQNIKPIEVTVTDGTDSITATLDLTTQVTTIVSELEAENWVDDWNTKFEEMSTSALIHEKSSNIVAYIGYLSTFAAAAGMQWMGLVSDVAWNAYDEELEAIHDFIWDIAGSEIFKSWNVNKNYVLISNSLNNDGSVFGQTFQSGDLFDDPTWVDGISLSNNPSKPEESSNLEAAFAIEMLNLFYPTI